MEVSEENAATIDCYSALTDEFYDSLGEDGGFERRALLNPAIFELLGDVDGRTVLDAGCGHGYLSRLLADRGAVMVGVEPAAGPFEYAVRVEAERRQGIRFFRRDLSKLGDVGGPFDAVVANMVLLDIPDWRGALANCVAVLKPGGLLVYSLHHPCWIPGQFEIWAQRGAVEIREYLNDYEQDFAGVARNFHRPLSRYVNETIRLGCDVVEMLEPQLAVDQIERPDQEILTRIPNFVVIAARRRAARP